MVDLLQFQPDGTGCLYRCFFDDKDADDVVRLGIVWGDIQPRASAVDWSAVPSPTLTSLSTMVTVIEADTSG